MDCKTISFPSQASITLPEGVVVQHGSDSLYHFSIKEEKLNISLLEHRGDLDSAIALAKRVHSLLESEEPLMRMTPPEIGFDATHIEIYGKDGDGRYRELNGKSQGPFSWVFFTRGDEEVLERRGSQIRTILQSLRPPEERKIDLGLKEVHSIRTQYDELHRFIEEAMVTFQVPGLSLAVIEKGEVIHSQGFGTTTLASHEKILPSTRFMIGSISKSMTTFLIAKLEEEGILHWNDRVIDLDPNFRLHDETLSHTITLEDLTGAASGIPRRDLPMLLNHTDKKAEDLLRDLRNLQATTDLNETFQYNNQLVAASGFIAVKRARADLSLEEGFSSLLQSYLFAPMEMKRTTVDFDEVVRGEDFAHPHGRAFDGSTEEIDLHHERFVSYVAPAGAIWSTVHDMANYALMELHGGLFGGKRVIGEKALYYRRKEKSAFDQETKYGLGWMVGKKAGLDLVTHGGGTCGFASNLLLFPTIQSGIVLLTNSSLGGMILGPIVEKLLSLWFKVDLQAEKLLASSSALLHQWTESSKRRRCTISKEMIDHFLGDHFHPELGSFSIVVSTEEQLYLCKDGVNYRLSGYREETGEEKLIVIDLPFSQLLLEPIFKDEISFRIKRGQECYDCRRV